MSLLQQMHFSNVLCRNLASMNDDELKQYAGAHPASKLVKEEMARRKAANA